METVPSIVGDIVAEMRSFEAAESTLDAEKLIEHFADVPGFHVYQDGYRLDFATLTARIREGFPTLRTIEGGFHVIEVIVVTPDAALATGSFHETVTAATGQQTRVRGAASWLWRHIDGRWRIVCGHSDHYADDEASRAIPPRETMAR
jgi:ketosteroid isomerase-like protein